MKRLLSKIKKEFKSFDYHLFNLVGIILVSSVLLVVLKIDLELALIFLVCFNAAFLSMFYSWFMMHQKDSSNIWDSLIKATKRERRQLELSIDVHKTMDSGFKKINERLEKLEKR